MKYIDVSGAGSCAIVTLSRGKVNALNEEILDEVRGQLEEIKLDDSVLSVILTGSGPFFSFGFDIPSPACIGTSFCIPSRPWLL
jgi:3,2-trans-enoyl-CoA isomerase